MKTLGILGGFGPETTAKFQLDIINILKNSLQRPPIVSWNTPIPLDLEQDLILRGTGLRKFIPFLIDGAKRLERAGAGLIVVPCNTLHLVLNEVQMNVGIPILNLIEETATNLNSCHIDSVILLGTGKTINSRVHNRALQKFRIKTITPHKQAQLTINQLIESILRKPEQSLDRTSLLRIVGQLSDSHHCQDVLLACTDLQLILPQKINNLRIHDTMHILALSAAKKMLE